MPVHFLQSKSAMWSHASYTKQKQSDVTREPNDANVFRKSKIKLKRYKFNLEFFLDFIIRLYGVTILNPTDN
jgi:hypothetical protein